MIYVCRVDIACRHVFDSDNGITDVQSLMEAIEGQFQINKKKQILLISGGEVLDTPSQKLYGLSAGSEESPIYLIDKTKVESEYPPAVDNHFMDSIKAFDMKQEIDNAIALKPSFQTLKARTDLANKIHNLGKYLADTCKTFYEDQYWQYQGFMALVANLDEYISSFRKRVDSLREQYSKFNSEKAYYKHLMEEIDKYIEVLSQIRLLPQMATSSHNQSLSIIATNQTIRQISPSSLDVMATSPSTPNLHHTAKLYSSFSSQSLSNLSSHQQLLQHQFQHNTPPSPAVATSPTLLKRNATLPLTNRNHSVQVNGAFPSSVTSLEAISELAAAATSGGFAASSFPEITMPQPGLASLQKMSTLLEWIKSTDSKNKLSSVIAEIRDMLQSSETKFRWSDLEAKIASVNAQIDTIPHLREIDGLTKRLFDLNGFLEKTKSFLGSQQEIAQSFAQNASRAQNLRDDSVLPDLCKAHEQQLEQLRSNHMQLIEITIRMNRAKLELIKVIHQRLNVIMKLQKRMADTDFALEMYYKQLKRLNVRLKLVEALKRAPQCYFMSIREIVRRKRFTRTYKRFATLLHALVIRVHGREMQRRSDFDAKMLPAFGDHFVLSILCAGLGDKVDLFLNDVNNAKFDDQLALLDDRDMESLEQELVDKYAEWAHTFLDSLSKQQQALGAPLSPQPPLPSSSGVESLTTTSSHFPKNPVSTSTTSSTSSGGGGNNTSSSGGGNSSSSSGASSSSSAEGTTTTTTTAPVATSPVCVVPQQFYILSSSPPPAPVSPLGGAAATPKKSSPKQAATSAPVPATPLDASKHFIRERLSEDEAFWRSVLACKENSMISSHEDMELSVIERIISLFSSNNTESTTAVVAVASSPPKQLKDASTMSSSPPPSPKILEQQENSKALLNEIRSKLNDSKQLLSDYQQEMLGTIRTITTNSAQQQEKFIELTQAQLKGLYAQLMNTVQQVFDRKKEPSPLPLSASTASVGFATPAASNSELIVGQVIEQESKAFSATLIEFLRGKCAEHTHKVDELASSLKSLKTSQNAEKQIQFNEAIRRATQDRDKLIEEFRGKEAAYVEEIRALKRALEEKEKEQAQKQAEMASLLSSNAEAVDLVKARLVQDAQQEKIALLEKQLAQCATLPVSTSNDDTVQLQSCNIGDLVVAVFSKEHQSYRVVNKTSSYLHFVHSAIYKSAESKSTVEQRLTFGSSKDENSPAAAATEDLASIMPASTIGEASSNNNNNSIPPEVLHMGENQIFFGKVIAKEFCIAKKDNNRFKVPIGTRFYRVKLKPFSLDGGQQQQQQQQKEQIAPQQPPKK